MSQFIETATRRTFLRRSVGLAALASLLGNNAARGAAPHFKPTAKRVIYLFQSGAPSQIDLFDHKPKLNDLFAKELPDSVRRGQRLTGMTATQESFPVAPSKFRFARHGHSGAWVSELLPHTARVADRLCFVRSMHTEAINHDPAVTFFQTGAQLAGRPSIGSWLAYGLGNASRDLPAFVVMISRGSGNPIDQPLYDRLWGSGFLPSRYQGVKFRSGGDPVLYLSNPKGVSRDTRRQMLDDLASAGLITDLAQRGLLDDTLVVWGGEFGRTVYCQGTLTKDDYGRDHHPRCFTIWLAGGGIKLGMTYGETDDFSYNITRDPVHVHDLHATLLHPL